MSVNQEMGRDTDRVNVNGGASALGRPIGASGYRVFIHARFHHGSGSGSGPQGDHSQFRPRGYIATEMVMAVPEAIRDKIVVQIPDARLGRPDEVAAVIAYPVCDDAAFVTGSDLSINGSQSMH